MIDPGRAVDRAPRTLAVLFLAGVCACRGPAGTPDRAALGRVERRGSGAAHVVLIPCHSCDWRSWEPFMERNAARYTMHAVTLAGMGGSAPPPTSPTLSATPWFDAAAEAIAAYVRGQGPERAVVVGHSLGAIVALKVTLDHPGVVSKLVLVDWGAVHPRSAGLDAPARLAGGRARAEQVLSMTPEEFQAQAESALQDGIQDPTRVPVYLDMVRRVSQAVSAQYSREMRAVDLRPRLGEIKIPLMAMFAFQPDAERGARLAEVQSVLAGDKTVSIQWFENTGHWIHEDQPARFDAALHEFIDKGD